jgi:hypothetical protein
MGAELYVDRYLALRYEDLLARPWEELAQLWAFLGADSSLPGLDEALQDELDHNPDAEWQREKAKEIAEPLQKGKQGSWQDMFTEQDRQVFHQVAAETLRAWGYNL